jgi:hypothetical protein
MKSTSTESTSSSAWRDGGWEVFPYHVPGSLAEPVRSRTDLEEVSPTTTCLLPADVEDVEDLKDALHTEREYTVHGTRRLKSYETYRDRRVGRRRS